MSRLFAVNCDLPRHMAKVVAWDSNNSLLDADFVLFMPFMGREDWHETLYDVLRHGKTVFYILTDQVLDPVTSKHSLLFRADPVLSEGTEMRLCKGSSLLNDYWSQFGDCSYYSVYLKNYSHFEPLVTTKGGEHPVGGMYNGTPEGKLIALPNIGVFKDPYIAIDESGEAVFDEDDEFVWTSKGTAWWKQYVATLEGIDNQLRSRTQPTRIPNWVQESRYKNKEEHRLTKELCDVQQRVATLKKEWEELEQQIEDAGKLKGLLFEQGDQLELAVAAALELLGFAVERNKNVSSEIDFILECEEGRCVGEVEGKDKRPIHIDKLRQLTVNVRVDLFDEGTSGEAKPVLVGNAYRLQPPEDRPSEHFTSKCMEIANITNTALIKASDLFEVATMMLDSPDPTFASQCRQAIFETRGKVVCFPSSAAQAGVPN